MSDFLKLLIAAIIGGMLSPYFSYFLSLKKSKREVRLEQLAEAYELTEQFSVYVKQTNMQVLWLIANQKFQIDISKLPKGVETPVKRLVLLLDFHLNAPSELVEKVEKLNTETLSAYAPLSEAVFDERKKEELYGFSAILAKDVSNKVPSITTEVHGWLKAQKSIIESEPTPFDLKYWVNFKNKMCNYIKTMFKGNEQNQ